MAFITPCPECRTQLKTAHRLPAGMRLTCPACGSKFITQKESAPFLPDAVLLEEPVDDRPPIARKKHKARERPRKREREPVDEKPAARVPRPALVVGLSLGVLLVGMGIGFLVYFVGTDRGPAAANDLLAYAPPDAVILSGFDIEELSAQEAFRKALERRAPADLVELDRAGLRVADLSRVLVARTPNNGNTCAVRFRVAPDRSRYLGPDLSGKAYAPFISATGNYRFGYFADPATLVLADRDPALQAIQEKGKGARLPGAIQEMVDRARGPAWRASGRVTAADFPRIGAADDGLALRVGPSSGTAVWIVPDGRMATVRFELAFENPGQAAHGASVLRGTFQDQRQVNDLGQLVREGFDPSDFADIRRGYDEASVSEGGSRASATLRLPASESLRAVGSVRY